MTIFAGTSDQALEVVRRLVSSGTGGYVTFTGAHGVAEATRSPRVMDAHRNASLVLPDGVPLTWVGRLAGIRMEQIAGPRFIYMVLRAAADNGWRVYLFGAQEATLETFAQRVGRGRHGVDVVGWESPPFGDPAEWPNAEMLSRIDSAQADVVLVALSTPKQELWMNEVTGIAVSGSKRPLLFGFGAAIDLVAGAQSSVPRWVHGSGVEWLYRLVKEPRRLWRRYAFAVPTFVWLALRHPARRT